MILKKLEKSEETYKNSIGISKNTTKLEELTLGPSDSFKTTKNDLSNKIVISRDGITNLLPMPSKNVITPLSREKTESGAKNLKLSEILSLLEENNTIVTRSINHKQSIITEVNDLLNEIRCYLIFLPS